MSSGQRRLMLCLNGNKTLRLSLHRCPSAQVRCHSLWVGKAGGELLRSSPPLDGALVLSASRFWPLAPFPLHHRLGSHVPYKSLVELRAAYMPELCPYCEQSLPGLSEVLRTWLSRGDRDFNLITFEHGSVWRWCPGPVWIHQLN
jgi:hypothetical protein